MHRSSVALIAGLVIVVLIVTGLFGGMMTGPGMMGGYWGYGMGSWWGLAMLAFWVLVIVGALALIASLWPGDRLKATDAPDGGLYRSREILMGTIRPGERSLVSSTIRCDATWKRTD